ncbi:MAG: HEAT repeat domain-containing protein [Planctomycetes bacterium]|nr:HEAT repeat domain-containing protein [Planctomycetota bacterium]
MDRNRRVNSDPDGRRSRSLAAAAATFSGRSTTDVLKIVRLLQNSDSEVRISALQSLGGIGGINNVPYVLQSLNDRNWHVRVAACRALSRMRAHTAKSKIFDSLNDRNAEVRCAAALALSDMGDRAGLPIVIKLVCTSGTHQMEALRAFGLIIKQKFPINQRGLKQAIRWIKLRRKNNIKF